MNIIPAILNHFQDAILENDATLAEQDIKPGGHLKVYIEGYRIRLAQALRTDYPALCNLLGKEEFGRLAEAYIKATPSTSYNLDNYSLRFAEFVATSYRDKE